MTELAPFIGRFHPLLVHFPIGILVLAVALQLFAWWRTRRRARGRGAREAPAVRETSARGEVGDTQQVVDPRHVVGARDPLGTAATLLLAVGAAAAVLAATTGYLLGETGDYAGETYTRHFWFGLTVAVVACWTALAAWLPDLPGRFGAWSRRVYAVSLLVLLAALVGAGHLGASLTHGDAWLTARAPAPIRQLLVRVGLAEEEALAARPADVDQALVFATLVRPVLAARCVSCHGAAKTEGGLRLDTPEGLKKGGDAGPAIVAGRSAGSEMVRRIWLPASHADVMPPRGQRPLTPAEASLVRWWIDQGARFDLKMADAQLAPDVVPAIEAVLGPIARGGPTLPRVAVAAADPAALAALRRSGLSVVSVADGTPFLHVHCTNVRAAFGDAQLAALEPIARQLLWLDVSGTQITDAGLAVVANFPHLTRLHLNGTPVTDAGLSHLARLARLEYLNLYDTRITDAGLAQVGDLKNLRALYVWKTGVTQAGVDRLKSALPRLHVEAGLPSAPPATPATARPSALPPARTTDAPAPATPR